MPYKLLAERVLLISN